jgi:hypothetical protein
MPKQTYIVYILTYNLINLLLHICVTLLTLFGNCVASYAILECNFSGIRAVVHHYSNLSYEIYQMRRLFSLE